MKVKIQQFLGQNHSWSICGQNIARALMNKGHEIHLNSTNGYEYFPKDLTHLIKPQLDKIYDMQISYTAMKNFPYYLSNGNQNRFGIWNYETTVLPYGFSKYYQFTDKLLPSSNFSKKIFIDVGIPESHIMMIPHGADLQAFQTTIKYPLKTKKKFKILANIAQPHIRKNIPGLLESFGQAFTKHDDVCLIAKVTIKKEIEKQFDVDFPEILKSFKRKYPNHADIELITHFIPNIAELYNSCDVVFSMTHAECFWLPGIEGMAAGKIVIAPEYGGQLDFMNPNNSLLIPGKIVGSPRKMQYWTTSPLAAMFEPDAAVASDLLKLSYTKYSELLENFLPEMKNAISVYNWDNVGQMLLDLCE